MDVCRSNSGSEDNHLGIGADIQLGGSLSDIVAVIPHRPGQFAHERFVHLVVPLSVLVALGVVLSILGLLWWPLSLLALGLLWLEYRLEKSKRWNPFPWLDGAGGEEAVARVL